MITNITADILQKYVETNEVVFQFCGELVEVSNDTEKENKETLIRYLRRDEEFDTLESLCYNFGTEPKEIKDYLYGHGFVYSEKQKQFRPIGYDSVTR